MRKSVSSVPSMPSIEASFRRAQTMSIVAKRASSSRSAGRTTLVTSNPRLPFDEEEVRVARTPRIERPPADYDARAFAVDPLNNVVLEASAGTGKTRVLVERYVNLL